jgi:hypothetical protein
MAATLLPIAPLVATEWLKGVGITAPNSAGVPTAVDITQTLPDEGSWATDIAITATVVPSNPDPYVPIRSTVFQVDVFGKSGNGDSRRLPWNRCFAVAEQIWRSTYSATARRVVLPGEYKAVRVTDVTCDREPWRLPVNPAGLAWVVVQIQITYLIDE